MASRRPACRSAESGAPEEYTQSWASSGKEGKRLAYDILTCAMCEIGKDFRTNPRRHLPFHHAPPVRRVRSTAYALNVGHVRRLHELNCSRDKTVRTDSNLVVQFTLRPMGDKRVGQTKTTHRGVYLAFGHPFENR